MLRTRPAVMVSFSLFAALCILASCDQKPAPGAGTGTGGPSVRGSSNMARVTVIQPDGRLSGPVDLPKLVLTEAEWKKRLTPEQYRITRDHGTEPAFCGGLLENKEPGVYACICCNLPLFSSQAKFDSGTGWPSFFAPVSPFNVASLPDHSLGMVRVEIRCARCNAHLGHVFEDGPPPTGLRFCLNSEALKFVAQRDLRTIAEDVSARRAEAVFAGGCFWCVEAVFEELEGVYEVTSGYSGGEAATANYEAVCTGTTGHAEAVRIGYDPSRISYVTLLKVHFATHDPTTLNRQGNDVGPQYRSAIFFANDKEKQLAEAFIADLTAAKAFPKPIVTTLETLKAFYPAEPYHQDYVCRNPAQPYVNSVALPKVEKLREKFGDLLKPAEQRPDFRFK
jgi:peptide methionine sulfoxide reductase msrA/msrB